MGKKYTSVPELDWRPIIPSTGNHTQPDGNADSRFISVGPRVTSTPTLVRAIIQEANPNRLMKQRTPRRFARNLGVLVLRTMLYFCIMTTTIDQLNARGEGFLPGLIGIEFLTLGRDASLAA